MPVVRNVRPEPEGYHPRPLPPGQRIVEKTYAAGGHKGQRLNLITVRCEPWETPSSHRPPINSRPSTGSS